MSACFSLGFRLLQDLTEIYQDDRREGEKSTLKMVSKFRKMPTCLSVEGYLGCDLKLAVQLKNIRRKFKVLTAYTKAIRL